MVQSKVILATTQHPLGRNGHVRRKLCSVPGNSSHPFPSARILRCRVLGKPSAEYYEIKFGIYSYTSLYVMYIIFSLNLIYKFTVIYTAVNLFLFAEGVKMFEFLPTFNCILPGHNFSEVRLL